MNIDLIKAKVLDLAIKGQLVEQRDDEKLSDEILSLPNIEGPFEIPNNWKWININKVTNKGLQKKPNKDFIYIDVSSIDNKTGKIINRKLLKPSNAPSRARKIVSSGAILYSMVRPYLKNICVVQNINEETIASTAFAVLNCKNNIVNTFLYRVLLSSYFNQYVSSKQKGISYPAISESDFLNAPIPYPPLKEQNRIVKKVEEIFSILDALKDHQTSLLSKLDLIKKVAIDKAIKGQLVEQREDEKLSDEVLTLPNIEGPFELPKNWKWININKVTNKGLQKKPNKDFIYIDVSSIDNKTGKIINRKLLKPSNAPSRARKIVSSGAILYSMVRPYLKNICVVQNINEETIASTAFAVLNCKNNIVNTFLYRVLLSSYFNQYVSSKQKGISYPAISESDFLNAPIPYPPLKEQNRIVKKVEEILSTVSTIENLLKSDKT